MTDVRALLRAERTARAPSKSIVTIKEAPSIPVATSRKRKVADEKDDVRKRAKHITIEGVPEGFFDDGVLPAQLPSVAEEDAESLPQGQDGPPVLDKAEIQPQQALDVDEDEWAAFERDVAATEHEPSANVLDAINSSTAIASAPMTASELAAQAREEQSTQRSRRDVEIEGEKEDAEQALATELDEMEALEQRVKKLRERREQIRQENLSGATESMPDTAKHKLSPKPATLKEGEPVPEASSGAHTVDEEDDDYDEEDDFMFRGRKV